MRQSARKNPLNAPCVSIASMAYSEQVGVYLQQGASAGEIYVLYVLIANIISIAAGFLIFSFYQCCRLQGTSLFSAHTAYLHINL